MGATQAEVAKKLNTTKSVISRMVNHAEDIKLSTLTNYARAIGKKVKIEIQKIKNITMLYSLDDLRSPPGNRLEALRGDYKGYHSIRINAQWRIIFRWQVWWSRFLGQRFWFSSFDSFLLSCSPVHPCWRNISY